MYLVKIKNYSFPSKIRSLPSLKKLEGKDGNEVEMNEKMKHFLGYNCYQLKYELNINIKIKISSSGKYIKHLKLTTYLSCFLNQRNVMSHLADEAL